MNYILLKNSHLEPLISILRNPLLKLISNLKQATSALHVLTLQAVKIQLNGRVANGF